MITTENLINYHFFKGQFSGNDRLMEFIRELESLYGIKNRRLYHKVWREYLNHKSEYDWKYGSDLLMARTYVYLVPKALPTMSPSNKMFDCLLDQISVADLNNIRWVNYPIPDKEHNDIMGKIRPYIDYGGDWEEFVHNSWKANIIGFYAQWVEMKNVKLVENWILSTWLSLIDLAPTDNQQTVVNIILRYYEDKQNRSNG